MSPKSWNFGRWGFYFPTPFKSTRAQGIQKGLRGFLSGCNKDSNEFHVGADLPADVDARVYAISEGIVAAKSSNGLSPDTVAVLIRHKLRSGSEFYAVYGNIRTALEPGMSVSAGQSIGVVGHSPGVPHLYYAAIATVGDTPPAPADWDLLPCSRWPDHIKYANPPGWLGPLNVADDSALNRCGLNGDGVVDSRAVELGRLMVFKAIPCTADLDKDGECTRQVSLSSTCPLFHSRAFAPKTAPKNPWSRNATRSDVGLHPSFPIAGLRSRPCRTSLW
jgi:murein DD-endopeptidase MepM/ murein hydrolase activator NlpD